MPRTIVLISCVKKKLPVRARARDLYVSDLFKKMLAFAESLRPDAIYILSAKHGLLELDAEIDPYEQTLKTMPVSAVRAWADGVLAKLAQLTDLRNDHFIILAGAKYREFLTPHMASFEVPMEGLTFGEQLHFLEQRTNRFPRR